ncbi:ACP S-malonyltransferase [Blastomonas sp. AAP53]|uniref:ACP S-malonyltransferase n=1 Tax=Blastomonas sp. AAP53 TaxID=1248760 RepID=UPI0002F80BA5|nr:ACP S-malonyltransferase [Blastomonas sp. AAP53]
MTRAFIFPGQGSQKVGMGKALAEASAEARAVFQEVDEALGQNLFQLMCDGPADELQLTENAQPAIMANAIAVLRVLQHQAGDAPVPFAYVAGHSLGEYSALCAAGSLDLATTARLLKLRGQAMQAAVPVGQGAMAALLGIEFDEAVQAAAQAAGDQVCAVANDNAFGQAVISGHAAAVERCLPIAKELGARKAMMLPVSAPFHCALMQPAADRMAEALADTVINAPCVPLFANVTAAPVSDPAQIRTLLVDQVTGMVRWRESVIAMRDAGVDHFIELGGKVLVPMIKRIVEDVASESLVEMSDIDSLLEMV